MLTGTRKPFSIDRSRYLAATSEPLGRQRCDYLSGPPVERREREEPFWQGKLTGTLERGPGSRPAAEPGLLLSFNRVMPNHFQFG